MNKKELNEIVEVMIDQLGRTKLYNELAKAQDTDELRANVEHIIQMWDMPQMDILDESDAFEERDILFDTLDYFSEREGIETALDELVTVQSSDELTANLEHVDQMLDLGNF